MRKDRLLKLADFLETVPRRAFNISNWQTKKADKPEGRRPGECGFAGCAVGWAAHQKLFPGLRIKADGMAAYRGALAFDAVDKLFDFEPRDWDNSLEAEYLFAGWHYPEHRRRPTPKQVARRIRAFVKADGNLPSEARSA